MRVVCTLLLVFGCLPLVSQAQRPLRNVELKIYSNHSITWTPLYGHTGQQHAQTSTKLFRPSFGLSYTTRKGHFFEVELNGLGSRKTVITVPGAGNAPAYRSENSFYSAGFRFEAGRVAKTYREGAWRFIYSLAVMPLHNRELLQSDAQDAMNVLYKTWNADVQFIPRLQYQISGSCRLDLNMPVTMARMVYQTQQKSGPLICDGGFSSRTNVEILPSVLSFRAGLSFRL